MSFIAIDLGARKSQICVRDAKGQIVEERRVSTVLLPAYLKGSSGGHVVVETSSEAFAVADVARECGHHVDVVPSVLSKALGVGYRGVKTDAKDARALSAAACRMPLPSVHIPSLQPRQWRSLNRSRETLVSSRTGLVNAVRGYLRTGLHAKLSGTAAVFAQGVRKLLEDSEEGLPMHIERLLVVIEELNVQIKAADKELVELTQEHAAAKLLKTIPGVGPVTASRFVAAIDDVRRFANASAVNSYLGLTAGERSSGQSQRRTGITKAGPSSVRAAVVQAAWCLWRTRPDDPMVRWAKAIALRSHTNVAICALSRKLTSVMYAMWRDMAPYQPRAANVS